MVQGAHGSNGTRSLTLLVAGGGTGGHVIPSLAVAREWLNRDPGRDVIFVGTQRGMETRLVSEAGIKLETIRSAGLKGMAPARLARNFAMLGAAFWDSAAILRRHPFAAAFGMGGYAAGPVMLMATMQGLPTVIFEPNASAGFTNRVLADMATRIATGYPSMAERWGPRAVMTGCPIRPEFFTAKPRNPVAPYRLLITGGSQGSLIVNNAVIAALDHLAEYKNRLVIVHQTGERGYNAVAQAYAQRDFHVEVAPFLPGIAERFAQADLIVCRSGATTVAEVAASGRAAIFIPFGAATDSHQLRNAEEMVATGGARLITESDLTGERLAQEIGALLDDPRQLVELGARAHQIARPQAAKQIVDLIEGVVRH